MPDMRLPRLAMSLRSLMVLIVGIGIGITLSDARRRWMHCKAMSGRIRLELEQERADFEEEKKEVELDPSGSLGTQEYARAVKEIEIMFEAYDMLAREFDRAAIFPWVPVPRNPFPSMIRVDYAGIGEPERIPITSLNIKANDPPPLLPIVERSPAADRRLPYVPAGR
jgi:hypothetical protein